MNSRGILVVLVLASIAGLVLGCGSTRSYTVERGDTLQSIADRNGTTVTALVQLNKNRYPSLVTNPQRLPAGWALEMPAREDAVLQFQAVLAKLAQENEQPYGDLPAVSAEPNDKIRETVTEIVAGINRVRADHNLPALEVSPTLEEIAQVRSDDMIRRKFFSHTDPGNGQVLFQSLIEQRRYPYLFAGENIAEIRNQGALVPPSFRVYNRYGASDLADQFVVGWVNSPDHFANIVNPHFHKTGVAVGVSADGTRVIATQVFSD